MSRGSDRLAKNFTLKQHGAISQYWKHKRIKCKADANLGVVVEALEKLLPSYHKLYTKKASTIQIILRKFFIKKENISILNVSNVLSCTIKILMY